MRLSCVNNSASDPVSDREDHLSLEKWCCAAKGVWKETAGCELIAGVLFLWVLWPKLEENFYPSQLRLE